MHDSNNNGSKTHQQEQAKDGGAAEERTGGRESERHSPRPGNSFSFRVARVTRAAMHQRAVSMFVPKIKSMCPVLCEAPADHPVCNVCMCVCVFKFITLKVQQRKREFEPSWMARWSVGPLAVCWFCGCRLSR